MPEQRDETRLELMANQLLEIVKTLRSLDSIREKYEQLLAHRRTLSSVNKQGIALSEALRFYMQVRQNAQNFETLKEQYLVKIRDKDPGMSKRLEAIRVNPNEELNVLVPIGVMLHDDPQKAIDHIKQNLDDIQQQLIAFHDKRTANSLRRIMGVLTDEERNELLVIIEDVNQWQTLRLNNRIEFFTERLMLYVRGGQAQDTNFKGIGSYFKDAELAREIYNTPEIRKLWTYKKEMQFFATVEAHIQMSIQQNGNWQGFYDFYNNLTKGKNYVRVVRDKFGNQDFANYLARLHDKVHENPDVWIKDLEELKQRLHDPTYQNQEVIQPASAKLLVILNKHLESLATKKEETTQELQDLINNKIDEIRDTQATIKQKFEKILTKRRRRIMSNWEKLKQDFELRTSSHLVQVYRFIQTCQDMLSAINIRERLTELSEITEQSERWTQFASRNSLAQGLSTDRIARLQAGISMLGRFEAQEAEILEGIANPPEQAIQEIEKAISHGQTKVIPDFVKHIDYIKATLASDFTIDINTLKNMEFEDQENRG
tara:strand:- start:17118 stop:18749 length:1632 start_codon:yes stop_codon:yes gene_type:complete